MKTGCSNIFAQIPEELTAELFENILIKPNVRIERIISKGHITPPGDWYDQAWDEWVILLQGDAIVRYEDPDQAFILATGDYLLIPANTRHRVEYTCLNQNTIWLAIHLNG